MDIRSESSGAQQNAIVSASGPLPAPYRGTMQLLLQHGGTLAHLGHLPRRRPYLCSSSTWQRLIADSVTEPHLEDLAASVHIATAPAGTGRRARCPRGAP
jgi:hypothetical protein